MIGQFADGLRASLETARPETAAARMRAEFEAAIVLLTATVSLALQFYFVTIRGTPVVSAPMRWFWGDEPFGGGDRWLANLDWAVGTTLAYSCLPALAMLLLRRGPADYGVKLRGATRDWPIYLAMALFMLPLLWVVSGRSSFLSTYPFYQPAADEPFYPRLFVWELAQAGQFVALEFFFRGFLLHGCKRAFGIGAVFAMTVPYCMIHFGKPLPETLASIVAGVALGTMSLKNRSIWLGAALHVFVATTMDVLALWREGWW